MNSTQAFDKLKGFKESGFFQMFYTFVKDMISSSAFGESPVRPTAFLDVIPSEKLPLFFCT